MPVRRASLLVVGLALALVATLGAGIPADAQQPPDAQFEAQALQIERQLLCPQCTNKRLDVCELAICHDMKQQIRERLAAGDEPDQIIFSFAARYGDRVLAELPREGFNLLLFGWVGGSILGVGVFGALFLWRLRRGSSPRAGARNRDAEPG